MSFHLNQTCMHACLLVMQYKLHAFADAVSPSVPEDASDDSVDIDMEKLKAEAKEVTCITLCFAVFSVNTESCVKYTYTAGEVLLDLILFSFCFLCCHLYASLAAIYRI